MIEAKEEALRIKNEAEAELKERRNEVSAWSGAPYRRKKI